MAFPVKDMIRLARPKQWAKGGFVLLGPVYGTIDGHAVHWPAVALTFLAFGFAASGCYVVNDIRDREADRAHPRKMHRPIASGAVGVREAVALAVGLLVLAAITAAAVWWIISHSAPDGSPIRGAWVPLFVGLYVANVMAYSVNFKHALILDVTSLALGFVLRVLGGCAAGGVEPSTWLLNVVLFASMFLGFAKRLGERRTLHDSSAVRAVQAAYTHEILRIAVGLTAVATLVTYAGYVQARGGAFTVSLGGWGFNVLWPTMIPAIYGLLRCIALVEKGTYDDPTELAWSDLGVLGAVAVFVGLTVLASVAATSHAA